MGHQDPQFGTATNQPMRTPRASSSTNLELGRCNEFKSAGLVAPFVQPEDEPENREPRLARRSPFALAKKLCPKCLSPLEVGGRLGGWLIPMSYYCPKCGYSGVVFVEPEKEGS